MPGPLVCFIDDSPFERRLFLDVFPAAWPEARFVVAESYREARRLLDRRCPGLWLLDLYGQDPEHPVAPVLPGREELLPLAPDAEAVWRGFDPTVPDAANDYLRRLFRVVAGWQEVFARAARAAGQSRAYGLHNLARALGDCPAVPAVAYTRKAQAGDIVAFLAAGGRGALLKPHAGDDAAIPAATRREAPALVARMRQLMGADAAAGRSGQ